MLASVLEQHWIVGPTRRSRNSALATDILLGPGLLLLKSSRSRLDQSTLNTAGDFRREYRSGVQRPWHRFFPGLEHLIQLPARLRIDQRVGVHEHLIHVAAQKQSVGGPYILDDRVDYIQGRQLLGWWCLQKTIRNCSPKQTTGIKHA